MMCCKTGFHKKPYDKSVQACCNITQVLESDGFTCAVRNAFCFCTQIHFLWPLVAGLKGFILDHRTVSVYHSDCVNFRTFMTGNKVALAALSITQDAITQLFISRGVVSPAVTHKGISYISTIWPLQSPKYVSVTFLNVDDEYKKWKGLINRDNADIATKALIEY